MATPKLTPLELKIMDVLWSRGPSSVREVHEQFPEEGRPAYTTVQTMLYRLEKKKAVRRAGKVSWAFIFEAAVSRGAAQGRVVEDALGAFGGRAQPLVAHLIQSGKLTLADVQEAEALLRELADRKNNQKG
jgi:predicted transcriptional regulator